MIWLTWRQFRVQAIVASAALAAFAITLAVTGPHLASLYDGNGLASCHTLCSRLAANFIDEAKHSATEKIFYAGVFLLYAIPALIGMFWGAPLVTREIESGSFRLAWNQSVTRSRWIAVKLGLVGMAAVATAGLLSLMTSWWSSPLYQAAQKAGANSLSIHKVSPPLFGATGIAPIGYAAFAFALGVTVGVLVRHPAGQRGWSGSHPASCLRIGDQPVPTVPRQPWRESRDYLSAFRSLLAAPVVRDRDRRRTRRWPGRDLLLAGPAAELICCSRAAHRVLLTVVVDPA